MKAKRPPVHVSTIRRKYKDKVYECHLLRRTVRVGDKVRNETVANLSDLPNPVIDLIRRALAGETFVPVSEALITESSLPTGHVRAVLATMKQLGIADLLSTRGCRERDLVLGMIVERILHPCSKLGTVRLWKSSTLAADLGLLDASANELYEALDWLLQRQERIEEKLAKRHLAEGGQVLYDMSNSHYEGRTCPLARLGHDKDGRRSVQIIAYGLLTDAQGRPVAIQVYPGNTGDPTTVPDQVNALRDRFGLKRAVLVGDRGMLTQAQITKLKEHPGLGWISALRSASIRKLVEGEALQLSIFDQQNLAEIASPEFPGERLVACFNPLLADERKRTREDLLACTEKELTKLAAGLARRKTPVDDAEAGVRVGRKINRFKVAKHFDVTVKDGLLTWGRREDSIQREAQLDGIYVIRTSEPAERLSAEDAVRDYKRLAQVERAFRCIKGIDLRVQPIFHRTEDHVRAHVFLCMLAYYVEWAMRRSLASLTFTDEELDADRRTRDPVAPAMPSKSVKAKKRIQATPDDLPVHSFETLLADLATQARVRYRVPGGPPEAVFDQLCPPTPLQQRAFELLGLMLL
jgi:transposase